MLGSVVRSSTNSAVSVPGVSGSISLMTTFVGIGVSSSLIVSVIGRVAPSVASGSPERFWRTNCAVSAGSTSLSSVTVTVTVCVVAPPEVKVTVSLANPSRSEVVAVELPVSKTTSTVVSVVGATEIVTSTATVPTLSETDAEVAGTG